MPVHTDSQGRVVRVTNPARGLDFVLSEPGHPIYPAPLEERFMRHDPAAAMRLLVAREEQLLAMREDPLRHGWEPPAWKLADALCAFPWVDPEFAERVRRRLKLPKPIRKLGLLGGNRSAKTTWCIKRTVQMLLHAPDRRAWLFHQNNDMSVEYHQGQFWKMLPAERRRPVREGVEYLAYKLATGFSENRAVLHNGSWASFRNYSQDKETIEGGEVDILVADELCPVTWSETFDMRVATRDGWVLHPFTPVDGYTPLVSSLRDGAECVLDAAGWLLPLDAKGLPDEGRAVELRDVLADALGTGAAEPPEAKRYARVPRVEKGRAPGRAVMFFHSSDNPFGNPAGVRDRCLADGREDFIFERFYGVARKSWAARFHFDRAVHVVAPGAVPSGGTNLMVADPANARNWFMIWVRLVGDSAYIYREWPCPNRAVRDHGHLGEWALPGGSSPDGVKGPGQRSLGWGLLRYKEEIARLEGWEDAASGLPVADWSESTAVRERIFRRIMDSRYASNPRPENDRPETVITHLEELGLYFDTAPGGAIEDGLQKIDSLLWFERTAPVGPGNLPRLFVSAECPNVIDALSRYVGVHPDTGRIDMASPLKDIIDCVRYALMCGTTDVLGADRARRVAAAPRARAFY